MPYSVGKRMKVSPKKEQMKEPPLPKKPPRRGPGIPPFAARKKKGK